jgi:hypothetical protein
VGRGLVIPLFNVITLLVVLTDVTVIPAEATVSVDVVKYAP